MNNILNNGIIFIVNILDIMDQKFFNGTIVWLKSGGPAMTIDIFHMPSQLYRCFWFVGTELKYGEFHEEALTDSDPTAPLGLL